MTKKENEERILLKIPILGYFFRKIKENQEAIETTLRTRRPMGGKIEEKSFFGIIKIVSGRIFNLLQFKKTERKWLRKKK